LVYDSQGFWIAQKRLSKGRFRWWPEGHEASQPLEAHQAQMLLVAGDPSVRSAPVWRPVK
jgi:transposase